MVAAVCSADEPAASALTLSLGGGIELSREPLRVRDRAVGVRHSLMLRDGARIRIDRIEPEGILRRVVATYSEPSRSGYRPVLLALAGSACNVMAGRRLVYDARGMRRSIEFLESNLKRAVQVEPLNPPVPAAAAGDAQQGDVRVAHVDSGVDYRLPRIASRLARDADGALVGFDFWDLDARPFDANPAHSAFHPQRHGTRTASLILEEAPVAVLVPYRYPRHHMSRMPQLVEHAAAAGVRIMNISMGSRRLSDWTAFEAAARAHPEMLFVVSAGNDGADIDETPVWPAALALDNLLTVTSSDASGLPARGSNWGRVSVDLAVPAEEVPVTAFDGRVREVSGSSYAAARVSALAACLLAAHPQWTVSELVSAILDRAEKPVSDLIAYVRAGTLRDPTGINRGACEAEPSAVTEVPLGAWSAEHLYPEGEAPAHAYTVALDLVVVSGAGWRVPGILRAVRRAAGILAQCEVAVSRARLRMVEAPRRYRYLHDAWSRRLVQRLDLPRPAVFFVEETLREPAFEAEAFGQANTRHTPWMRDTVWITRAAEDVGVVLAHELFHVLADLGRHESAPGNLMNERVAGGNTRLHDWQCERLRKVAAAFGLAVPVQ
ncbi:MAG: S8 family serine peptidase [Chromatiales bacterium]|nr:S8 family serine peptidase [Chromatiales bacterium]